VGRDADHDPPDYRNIKRDPQITVLIHSAEDPWDWSEVRGHVVETVGGDDARRHIDEVSRKYTGQDCGRPVGPEGRVILKVAPDNIYTPQLLGSQGGLRIAVLRAR
jgi:hypothetical protein